MSKIPITKEEQRAYAIAHGLCWQCYDLLLENETQYCLICRVMDPSVPDSPPAAEAAESEA